jgi:hypothetical protein
MQYSMNLSPPDGNAGVSRHRPRKKKASKVKTKSTEEAHLELQAEVSRLDYLASVLADSDSQEEKLLAEAELFASFNGTWKELP